MSNNSDLTPVPVVPACPVRTVQQIPLNDEAIVLQMTASTPIIKIPVVLAERKIQVVLETDITLTPAATEIKRVTKNVFLTQVKLVPVRFSRIGTTDYFEVTRAKLFVAGYIRKNIEYTSGACNGALRDRVVDIAFTGFAEVTETEFLTFPVIGVSDSSKAQFLNEYNDIAPRLDKYFFQNLVKYNEQPYGELIGANFFELDFSPIITEPEGTFCTVKEKIVMDLYLKVLQVQQHQIVSTRIIPEFDEGSIL